MQDWGVIIVQPQRHKLVADELTQNNFEFFLPKERSRAVVSGRRVETTRPLLGRYVLVVINSAWRALIALRGVASMIMDRSCPVPQPLLVCPKEVDYIRAQCDGSIVRASENVVSGFTYGDKVMPKSGPFMHSVGSYESAFGKHREVATFVLFGKERKLTFKSGELIAA